MRTLLPLSGAGGVGTGIDAHRWGRPRIGKGGACGLFRHLAFVGVASCTGFSLLHAEETRCVPVYIFHNQSCYPSIHYTEVHAAFFFVGAPS